MGQVKLDLKTIDMDNQFNNILNPKLFSLEANRLDLVSIDLIFELYSKANLTDYLSYSPSLKLCKFIVSEGLHKVLEKIKFETV